MTQKQVREVVKITIDELIKAKFINTDSYQAILKIVDDKLNMYFDDKSDSVSYALHQLSDDTYIDIIYLQYRDSKTLEWVAEYYNVDVSTIKRNKKRLICKIYELLEES